MDEECPDHTPLPGSSLGANLSAGSSSSSSSGAAVCGQTGLAPKDCSAGGGGESEAVEVQVTVVLYAACF